MESEIEKKEKVYQGKKDELISQLKAVGYVITDNEDAGKGFLCVRPIGCPNNAHDSYYDGWGMIHDLIQEKLKEITIKYAGHMDDIRKIVQANSSQGKTLLNWFGDYAVWENAVGVSNEDIVLAYLQLPDEQRTVPVDADKRRLFVDMDGTLCEFKTVDTLEKLYERGYFANLQPIPNVVEAVRKLCANPNVEVFILSSVLSDSKYARQEKNMWLDTYLPEISREHRLFPPCGQNKIDYVPGGIRSTDVLFDDYSRNLHAWEPPAHGVKLYNGINGTHGTWRGDAIRMDKPQAICTKLESVLDGHPVQDVYMSPDAWQLYRQLPEAVKNRLEDMEIVRAVDPIQGMTKENKELVFEVVKNAWLKNDYIQAGALARQVVEALQSGTLQINQLQNLNIEQCLELQANEEPCI